MSKTQKTLSLVIAGLTLAAVASAQDRPFAAGPQHPMNAVLPKNSPFAQALPRHLNVPPIPMPHDYESGNHRQNVASSSVAEYDPINRVSRTFQTLETSGLGGQGTAGQLGSVPGIDLEKQSNHRGDTVFGADDRQVVSNVTAYPWRCNCKLYMTFPNGQRFVGSGTLINSKYISTCGHCVYSAANGGWATKIEVVPGMYGTYRPYGSAWATNYRTYQGWTNNGDRQYDFAVVTLDRNIGASTGWYGYAYVSNLNNWTGNFGGYDADVYGGLDELYRYGGMFGDCGTGIYYYIDMKPGSSGSGVYVIINGSRYVVGSNGWESSSWNFATKITSQRYTDISNWIASGH